MDSFLQDARYAARAFARTPLFTAVAILTVGLGVGANATVFSFVSALLWRPTPGLADPSSLVSVYTSDFSSGPYGSTSYPDFESLKTDVDAFSQLAAYRGLVGLLRVGDSVERVRAMTVSGEFFAVTGISPAAGRLLGPGDTGQSAAPVAVIGHALWQRAFGGEPEAIGRSIALNGVAHSVVGIAPAQFDGLNLGAAFEIWTPLAIDTRPGARQNRGLSLVGRLRGGSALRQTQAQVDGVAARLAAAYPESNRGTLGQPDRPRPMSVVPHTRMHPAFRSEVAMLGAILLGAVALVLLIACANVAGLLLSRATARQREVAVRLALGATRLRLLRQMLTESVLLGAAGGGIGLLFALWTADALPSFFPAEQARMLDAGIDGRVLAFTALAALVSGVLVGLAPALQGIRLRGTAEALRVAGALTADGRFGRRSRLGLVVGQIAVASVLLIGAGLLTRSLSNALEADLGYGTRDAVLTSVELPTGLSAQAVRAFYDRAIESVGALPGVESVGIARAVPVAGTERRGFRMEGYVPRAGEDTELHFNAVSRDYFSTMQVAVIAGRPFDVTDGPSTRRVAIVNDLFAQRYFGGDAVGRTIQDSGNTALEIVGVVRATRRLSLQEPSKPVVFYPLEQVPSHRVMLVARTGVDPGTLAEAVRRTVTDSDRQVAVFRTVTLEAHLAEALTTNRLTLALVGTCGGMALLLAMVGVYGIVAFSVARRTREIGVRMALGARPAQVFRLIVSEGGRVIALGVVVGALGAAAGTRLLGSMLYGVSATDPLTFAGVPLTLALVALLASCLPAFRALRLNPVVALRQE